MFMTKKKLVLLFSIALIVPNYGKTMEICEKSAQNPIDKENQLIYDKLVKEEDELLSKAKQMLLSIRTTPTNSKERIEVTSMVRTLLSEHQKEYCNFIKKICTDIVRNDIKNKARYTIALGLKIGNNNQITMELLPLNDETKVIHNKLLFALSLNPENKEALQELQKLNADRVNKSESKSAESFFPKIALTYQANPTIGATYNSAKNMIYIYDKTWLSVRCLHKIIHEFIHRLQHAASYELGGIYAGPLDQEKYYSLKNLAAMEIEACDKSIEMHPDPHLLLEWLAPQVKPFDQNQNDLLFPYYSPACEYVVAYKQCLKNNINISDKLKEIYEVAHEHYKKRKEREDLLADWEYFKVDPKKLPNYAPRFMKDEDIRLDYFTELAIKTAKTEDKKNLEVFCKHSLDTMEKAGEGIYGCETYFELKEKFGLIPK